MTRRSFLKMAAAATAAAAGFAAGLTGGRWAKRTDPTGPVNYFCAPWGDPSNSGLTWDEAITVEEAHRRLTTAPPPAGSTMISSLSQRPLHRQRKKDKTLITLAPGSYEPLGRR